MDLCQCYAVARNLDGGVVGDTPMTALHSPHSLLWSFIYDTDKSRHPTTIPAMPNPFSGTLSLWVIPLHWETQTNHTQKRLVSVTSCHHSTFARSIPCLIRLHHHADVFPSTSMALNLNMKELKKINFVYKKHKYHI